ncbi:MAG: hypothetical protein ACK4YP_24455 [Myxococcota bacterium]
MIWLLLACASDPAPPSPMAAAPVTNGAGEPAAPADPAAAGDTPKVDTMLGQVPGVKFVGEWTSKGCDARGYARNLGIFENGEYAGVDLVSPCPTNARCMWSGIVGYAGIWKQEGSKLLLREIGAPTAPGSPHPTEIVADFDGRLVENGCIYERGLTVPDGYTAEQVRPTLPGSQ